MAVGSGKVRTSYSFLILFCTERISFGQKKQEIISFILRTCFIQFSGKLLHLKLLKVVSIHKNNGNRNLFDTRFLLSLLFIADKNQTLLQSKQTQLKTPFKLDCFLLSGFYTAADVRHLNQGYPCSSRDQCHVLERNLSISVRTIESKIKIRQKL
jgi:hypothetical protein